MPSEEEEIEVASVYEVHHWECPYCGMGFEDEADVPDIFECEDCHKIFRLD